MKKDSIAQYITRWCHLKTWPPPIITSQKCCKNKGFLMISLENLNWPYYNDERCTRKQNNSYTFTENLSCPCNHELKFSQKYPRFNEFIWKFELTLLSRAESFAKKTLLMMPLENSHCTCYHEVNFSQK